MKTINEIFQPYIAKNGLENMRELINDLYIEGWYFRNNQEDAEVIKITDNMEKTLARMTEALNCLRTEAFKSLEALVPQY